MNTITTAAALCREYAANLSDIPGGADIAMECASIIEQSAELAPALPEIGLDACQVLLLPSMEEIYGWCS